MPNNRNAAKAARQNEKRRLRNRAVRSRVRTAVRMARAALSEKSRDVGIVVAGAIRSLDKAVTKGVIHRNTAARTKSALARRLATLG